MSDDNVSPPAPDPLVSRTLIAKLIHICRAHFSASSHARGDRSGRGKHRVLPWRNGQCEHQQRQRPGRPQQPAELRQRRGLLHLQSQTGLLRLKTTTPACTFTTPAAVFYGFHLSKVPACRSALSNPTQPPAPLQFRLTILGGRDKTPHKKKKQNPNSLVVQLALNLIQSSPLWTSVPMLTNNQPWMSLDPPPLKISQLEKHPFLHYTQITKRIRIAASSYTEGNILSCVTSIL